jgi:hypothetical protein
MSKSKILLTIAGFAFAATWVASSPAVAQPEASCQGNFDRVPRGQAKQRDISDEDFDDIDDNTNQHICCKETGSGNQVCKDDR